MGRDERVYSEPMQFRPERYEHSAQNVAEPPPVGHFGFGRRFGEAPPSPSPFLG